MNLKLVRGCLPFLCFCMLIVCGLAAPSVAQDGEALFKNRCLVCHTVGKGKRVGPDLVGIHERRSADWFVKFVQASQAMVDAGDPDAVAIYKEYAPITMPDQQLSDAEVLAILDYIKAKSPASSAGGAAAAPEPEKPARPVTQADIDLGAKLFDGRTRLAAGGASCVSCHHVNSDMASGGGMLARELTDVFSRMDGAAVQAIISNAPFPVMAAAYADAPVTEDEAHALSAFLEYSNQEQFYQLPSGYGSCLFWGGLIGAVLLFILLGLSGMRRKKQSVNHDMYARQDDQLNK